MVQLTDRRSTLEAVRFADTLVRGKQSKLVLVKMVPVPRLAWLGTELADVTFTRQEVLEISEYERAASAKGIGVDVQVFQYVTLRDAIVQAAEYFGAQIVFAALPTSRLAVWGRVQTWLLREQLAQSDRQLYSLHDGVIAGDPTQSILVSPVPASAARRS